MQRTIGSKSRGRAVTASLKALVCCGIKEKLWFDEISNDSKSGLAQEALLVTDGDGSVLSIKTHSGLISSARGIGQRC